MKASYVQATCSVHEQTNPSAARPNAHAWPRDHGASGKQRVAAAAVNTAHTCKRIFVSEGVRPGGRSYLTMPRFRKVVRPNR